MNLERLVHAFPEQLGREHFEHRRLEHVIFQAAIDQRRRDRGHRFHRVGVGRDPRDFLFHQMKIAERFVELFPRVRVLHRQLQARLGRAGATGAERRPAKVEDRQRDL